MKNVPVITGSVLGVLLLILVIFAGISGAFTNPAPVSEKVMGPYTLVYKEHKGDYGQSGKIQMEVYEGLKKELGVETTKGFGIYYDDPSKVKKEDLRSEVGCILEPADITKAEQIKAKYMVKTLEPKMSVTTEFPFVNPMSVMFGIFKAYPALAKYMQEKGINDATFGMEIYDIPAKKIIYIFR